MRARRSGGNKKWALIKFCMFTYIFFSLFVLVWLRKEVVSLEYDLGQFERQKVELAREGKLALAERANLYSAGKIEEVAMKQFGMNLPKREMVYFVKREAGAAPYKASVKADMRYNRIDSLRRGGDTIYGLPQNVVFRKK